MSSEETQQNAASNPEQYPQIPMPFDGMPDIDVPVLPEVVVPTITDEEILRINSSAFERMWRAPFGASGGRYYFRSTGDRFYSGYSTWTKSVLPTNARLIQWKVDQGEQGEEISLESREYGTCFHLHVARHESHDDLFRFKFGGPLSYEWRAYIEQRVKELCLPVHYIQVWTDRLLNDFAAYFRWKKEHRVNVIACEVPLWDDNFLIATPVDMIVQCLVRATPYAKEPTVPAVCVVDFKTGENGSAYDEYSLQLKFCQYAWNKRFAGTKYECTGAFNWSPKKRSASPGGYHFADNGRRFTDEQFLHLAHTNAIMRYNEPGGKVRLYTDGENESDVTLQLIPAHEWLRQWQQRYAQDIQTTLF